MLLYQRVRWLILSTILTRSFTLASRAYPLGCSNKPSSYSDYDNCPFPVPGVDIRDANDFQLLRRLGTGKFSDVFEAVDVLRETVHTTPVEESDDDGEVVAPTLETLAAAAVVIKCLKPVSERKIKRELLILQRAAQLPNLARLVAIVLPPTYNKSDNSNKYKYKVPKMPSLIMEHAGPNAQWLCHNAKSSVTSDDVSPLSDYEIRYYIYHLLVALDSLHSNGIMHRDVKPRNVLINRLSPDNAVENSYFNPLMLIDLGLADFYQPGQLYNVRVASRHYKSPELLLGQEMYDYAIDMWGVGCILAGLLLRQEPLWRGSDNVDQLGQIVSCLGTNDCLQYIKKCQLKCEPEVKHEIAKYHTSGAGNQYRERRPWTVKEGSPEPSRDGIDLLDQLLVYDPDYRLSAKQAMAHSFFDSVRERVEQEVAMQQLKQKQTQPQTQQQQQLSQTSPEASPPQDQAVLRQNVVAS